MWCCLTFVCVYILIYRRRPILKVHKKHSTTSISYLNQRCEAEMYKSNINPTPNEMPLVFKRSECINPKLFRASFLSTGMLQKLWMHWLWVSLPTWKPDSPDINVCILAMSTFSVHMSDLTKRGQLLNWQTASMKYPAITLDHCWYGIHLSGKSVDASYYTQTNLSYSANISVYLWRRKSPFFVKILSSECINWSLYDDSMPENTEFLYE